MHIHKLMELLGLGDDKPEELEAAMAKELLPDIPRSGKAADGSSSADLGDLPGAEERAAGDETGERDHLIKVGRCPSCGDEILERAGQPCAWCNAACTPDKDGYHLVHVALGAFQERHHFCSDDCFEAFRRMYPARVHRNCYERSCRDCDFCIKRYIDESDGFPGQDKETRPRTEAGPGSA